MDALTFWTTTWGRIQPDDVVEAPDGSRWQVVAVIYMPGTAPEYHIVRTDDPGQCAWSPHQPDQPVIAARPTVNDSDDSPFFTAAGNLRAGGFEVDRP